MSGACQHVDLAEAAAQTAPARTDSIVVTGTWEPLELDELDRSVTVLPIRSEELLLNSWMDALRLDPSIDLRERAPNGVQTDISIRGANFGQTSSTWRMGCGTTSRPSGTRSIWWTTAKRRCSG